MRRLRMCLLMVFAGVLALMSGCAALPRIQPIEVGGLFIRNDTSAPVSNVKVRVKRTGAMVSCSYIPAGKECSTTFPARTYQGNPITVSWEQGGRVWSPGEFLVRVPENLASESAAIAVVNIGGRGSVSARLEQ